MGALREFGAYAAEYMAAAGQLATHRLAREWMDAGVPARDAAEWASQGYMPAEAAPLIAQGVTPALAGEMDQLGDDIAGGPEERVAQRIDELVRDGVLADPQRVRVEQDPNDPDHMIVRIKPEDH